MASNMDQIEYDKNDLDPQKRLKALIDRARKAHSSDNIDVSRYLDISLQFISVGKYCMEMKKYEEALFNLIRYQALVKVLRKHAKFRSISLGRQATFEYRFQETSKLITKLKQLILKEYEDCYKMADFSNTFEFQDLDQYSAPSDSQTIFASSPSTSAISDVTVVSIKKYREAVSSETIATSATFDMAKGGSVRFMQGMKRSIFATKQIKEFDEIHKQRRIVKGHRTIIVPSRVTTAFSYISRSNNIHNIETCGYLAGKEVGLNELLVTQLLIPQQIGFSDFFKVLDCDIVTRYLDQKDLIILGWIHSHPIETGYLSSSDQHYHSIFQNIVPEAIAMVYSPKEMKCTNFNLTPVHGLQFILNCNKKGFHTHPTDPPIVMKSHHAVSDLYADLMVKDFRRESIGTTALRQMSSSLFHQASNVYNRLVDNEHFGGNLKTKRK